VKHHILKLNRLWLIIAIATTILTIILAGCASNSGSSATATSTSTPTSTETSTPTTSPSPTESPSPTPSATPTPTPSSTVILPEVFILTPLYNVTIPPGDIAVTIKVTNFSIVNKIGQPNISGEGHVIYYLDVIPPANAGKSATGTAGTFFETADPSYTWKNVAAGDHTVSVQLVNNDGTSLSPPITATEPILLVVPSPSPSETATPSATTTP
jgi:hypothetical protein